MREFIVKNNNTTIPIGREGENDALVIKFPYVKEWESLYGSGTFELMNHRPDDVDPYPCVVDSDGDSVLWIINASDVAQVGRGRCQLTYVVNDTIAKSIIFATTINESIGDAGDPPAPYQSWVTDVLQAGAAAVQSAESAAESAASALSSAESASASETNAAASETNAATSENNAEIAKDAAEEAQRKAEEAEESILDLTATASVDSNVGTPSVTVTVTEDTEHGHKVMDFDFHNMKGDRGDVDLLAFEYDESTGQLTAVYPKSNEDYEFYYVEETGILGVTIR